MTARHQIHVGNRRLGRDRASIDATPAPTTGEMLQAAREKKGVDLYRAERDTKIRARYLAALEQSDGEELPSPVYTKGFLRNYALYLGLDPEEVLGRWKSETVAPRHARPVVVAPPMPLEAPRRGFTLTPGLLVAVALSLVVLAFIGYVVIQVFRFSQPPLLGISSPAERVFTVDAERYTLAGTADPGSSIRIVGVAGAEYDATADTKGDWTREVPLSKGRNDFRIVATDAGTGKESPAVDLIVTVPLPMPSGGPTLPPGATPRPTVLPPPVDPATLALTLPMEGASSEDGTVLVQGTTNGTTVTIAAGSAPDPTRPQASPSASSAPSGPSVVGSPGAAGAPGAPGATGAPGSEGGPAPHTVVAVAGGFSDMFVLTPGTWRLTITATGPNLSPTIQARTVSVAFKGITVVVQAKKGSPWIKVWLDGLVAPGYANGKLVARGGTQTFTAKRSISVRTGYAAGTGYVVNGVDRGILGRAGNPETWLFQVGREPVRTASR